MVTGFGGSACVAGTSMAATVAHNSPGSMPTVLLSTRAYLPGTTLTQPQVMSVAIRGSLVLPGIWLLPSMQPSQEWDKAEAG